METSWARLLYLAVHIEQVTNDNNSISIQIICEQTFYWIKKDDKYWEWCYVQGRIENMSASAATFSGDIIRTFQYAYTIESELKAVCHFEQRELDKPIKSIMSMSTVSSIVNMTKP